MKQDELKQITEDFGTALLSLNAKLRSVVSLPTPIRAELEKLQSVYDQLTAVKPAKEVESKTATEAKKEAKTATEAKLEPGSEK